MEKSRTNNEAILNTHIEISNLTASIASDRVTFNLDNSGIQKLWDFKKFDLFITYDADIDGTPTRVTEKLNNLENSVLPGIAFDGVTSFTQDCSNCSFSHTVSSSENTLLIVGVAPKKLDVLSSVTYDGQSLTEIRTDVYSGVTETSLWYLLNPSTGSNTVTASLSEAGEVIIGAISFSLVNQTDAIYQHTGTNGISSTPSINVDANCNTLIVSNLNTLDGPMSANSGQTDHWSVNYASMMSVGSTLVASTSGTYQNQWTNSAGVKEFAISSVVIKPTNGMYCLDNGDWIISILNDVKEPGIINKDEISEVTARVQYNVTSGTVVVLIGTDNGVTSSLAITVS